MFYTERERDGLVSVKEIEIKKKNQKTNANVKPS